MKQFMCQCGCGQVGQVSKWWKPSKPLPRFLPRHALRVYNRTKVEKMKASTKPIQVRYCDRLTKEQIEYIKENYHPNDRRFLAKEMGIPKTIFNFVCIELGLRNKWEEKA